MNAHCNHLFLLKAEGPGSTVGRPADGLEKIMSENNAPRSKKIAALMPFVILALAFLHISVIHSINSTSNFNVRNAKQTRTVKLPDILLTDLYPLLIIKDIVMVTFTMLVSFLFLVYNPEYFTNFVNWEKANPQLTPAHIVPEWYFLPFYGLVKLIPHKVLGICSMVLLILFPLTLPFINIYK